MEIIKVDKYNNEIKIKGVKFELYSEEFNKVIASGITDEYGKLKFSNIRTGDYKIYEVDTNEWYRPNNEKHSITIKKDETTYKTIENEEKKGYISIIKYDRDYTNIKLAGAKFTITNSKGIIVDTLITDNNGYAKSKELPIYDVYTVKEIQAPSNYYINKNETTIKYNSNEDETTKELKYYDIRKEGNLKVYKVDEQNHEIAIGNVEFELYSKEFDKIIGTYYTDVNGEIYVENLRVGDYLWIEKTTNKWYNLAENTNVKVEWNKTTETTILNKLKVGRVKVIKVDKDNNEILLSGVKFEVKDNKGNVLEVITTNKNGEAVTKEYPIRDYENLILKEIETLKEYKLDDKVLKVTLKADEIITKTIENEVKKAQIKVIKVDQDNNEIKLAGVVFEVLDQNENIVETLVTDKNGEAITKRLPILPTYIVREKSSLKEYIFNAEEITKIKLEQDEIRTLIFENELKKAKIQVIKVDKENHELKIKDVVFEVYNSKGELVDTIITNENGIAITKEIPVNEVYSLKEVQANKYYKLNKEIKKIDLTKYIEDYKNNIIESITIENQVKKGTIKVIKTDGDTTYPLKDIVFEIYNENGNLLETIITNENGEATSREYPIYEQYTVVEKQSKKGYILNDKPEIVELQEDEITNLTFENSKEKGKIKIIKTSSNGKVEGFTFKITGTTVTDEKIEMVVISDKDGLILIDDVLVGKYIVEEIRDEEYEETEPQTIIVKNGETAEVSFYNKLIEVEVPQTSDDRNITLWFILLTISIIGIIILVVYKFIEYRKNK